MDPDFGSDQTEFAVCLATGARKTDTQTIRVVMVAWGEATLAPDGITEAVRFAKSGAGKLEASPLGIGAEELPDESVCE